MNNFVIKNSIQFILLVLLQVLILNNIHLFGHLNPYIYIVFVFFYPLRKDKGSFLILSFLLGLCIDFFSNSGGINAASTLLIAFIRLPLLTKILNKSDFEHQTFDLRSIATGKIITYVFSMTFIHHLVLFCLEYFSFNRFGALIQTVALNTIFTSVLIFISIILFTKKK